MMKNNNRIMRTKKVMVLVSFFAFLLCIFPMASASFLPVKNYDQNTQTVTISNMLGLGQDYLEATLVWGDTKVPVGIDTHVGTFNYTPLHADAEIGDLSLTSVGNGNVMVRGKQYKVLTYVQDDLYVTQCTQLQHSNGIYYENCTWVEDGTYMKEEWIPLQSWLNKNDFTLGETYTIGVFVDTEVGDVGDWVPTLSGFQIDEWAVWTSDLNVGLKTYLALNESSGTSALDSTGQGNGATLYNTPTWNDGKIGNALSFLNTSTEYANITHSILGTTETSFVYWIKPTQTLSSANGDNEYLFGTHYAGGDGYLAQVTGSDGTNRFNVIAATTNVISVPKVDTDLPNWFQKDQWALMVISLDSTGSNNMYVFSPSGNGNYSSSTSWTPFASSGIVLGATGDLVAGYYFNGTLDEFAVYNRTISYTEAVQFYNGGLGITYTTLLPPSITLNSPIDGYNMTSDSITFNASVSSPTPIVNVSLIIDGTYNETNTSGFNNTEYIFTKNLADGDHTWAVQTCTASVCINSSTRTLNDDYIYYQNESYDASILEGASTTFTINFSTNGSDVSIANLTYNGTGYLGSYTKTGNNYTVTRTITAPDVSAATNLSWYWNITQAGGTTSFTAKNQTVSPFTIDDCSVNSVLLYNFTMLDEITQVKIPTTQNITGKLTALITSTIDGSDIVNLTTNYTINYFPVCINNNMASGESYYMDLELQYEADDYSPEFYNIQQETISSSNLAQNISLYDLDNTTAQVFKITYRDSAYLPVSDVLVTVKRKYIDEGVFKTVEIPKTDSTGETLAHLELYDTIYTFVMSKNGEILDTFNNYQVKCENLVLGQCSLSFNSAESAALPDTYDSVDGVSYIVSYDNDTRLVSVDFVVEGGLLKNISLTVNEVGGTGASICSDSLESTSGTLSCTIPATYDNSTAVIKVYSDGVFLGQGFVGLSQTPKSLFGLNLVFLSLILLLTLVGVGISSNPTIFGVFLIMGAIISIGFNLTANTGIIGATATILWLIIAVVLVLFKGGRK